MKLYKNTTDRNDNCIYIGNPSEIEIPDGFLEATRIYHVMFVNADEDFDYKISDTKGRPSYVRFASESGRSAYQRGGTVPKSSDLSAVTNPDCLTAMGQQERLVYLESEEPETTTTEQPE
jgi:hypothetical protein